MHNMPKQSLQNRKRTVSENTKQVNQIKMETFTMQVQIEQFRGSRKDEEFSYIQRRLLENLEGLESIKGTYKKRPEVNVVTEIETNIKRSLRELERKAAQNDHFNFKTKKPSAILVKTHSSAKIDVDYEKSQIYKAKDTLQEVKSQVNDLESSLEQDEPIFNIRDVEHLEQKIILLYNNLDTMETGQSEESSLKQEMFKELVKYSGRLKRARRRSSAVSWTTDSVTVEDNEQEFQIEDRFETSKENKELDDIRINENHIDPLQIVSINSFEGLNNRPGKLHVQISHIPGTSGNELKSAGRDASGSKVDAKIKMEAIKLAWDNFKTHIYTKQVGVETMQEMVLELEVLQKDLFNNAKQLKKYVKKHQGETQINGFNRHHKERLKEILEHLKALRTKISCFHGLYEDQMYMKIKGGLENCLEQVEELGQIGDIKTDLAKMRIKNKVIEYVEILDEKSLKL